uniref:Retrovirus-related Pol polyprotein from transposon opus n=1 Tax=Cajanus cajan TaxID=3821 RepID=A0A151RA15_CAJCA|nr:Retrovirus-related Pol polyprotein from transposon opus [Cajanus cajan]
MLLPIHGLLSFGISVAEDDTKLDSSQTLELDELLQKYTELFVEPTQLHPKRRYDHKINLVKDNPICLKRYKYPHTQKEEIERQIKHMLSTGFIRESNSSFASPLVLVKKKDATWRCCTDFHRLNAMTVKNRFPIPLIEDLLDELKGAKYFRKLDLRSGYNQVQMAESDIYKTTFRTHTLYGYKPSIPCPIQLADSVVEAVDYTLKMREQISQLLHSNLTKALERVKWHANLKRVDREYAKGDLVYLKIQPYKQHSLANSAFHKLAARYYGPFKVLERISKVAYRLELLVGTKIHDVFHISLLKKTMAIIQYASNYHCSLMMESLQCSLWLFLHEE